MELYIRRIWQISLSLAVLMFVIGIAIDSKDVSRYASRMERLMQEGDYKGALEVGDESDKTDKHLLDLRMKALAHEHLLGERLFSFPIVGKGGAYVRHGGDYELCAYLIDKDLDRFVDVLPRYYQVDGKLPRYYREALIQYNHLRSNPKILYHDAVLDTDYQDMQQLEKQYPDKKAAQVAVFRQYEGTYWYYFAYVNP